MLRGNQALGDALPEGRQLAAGLAFARGGCGPGGGRGFGGRGGLGLLASGAGLAGTAAGFVAAAAWAAGAGAAALAGASLAGGSLAGGSFAGGAAAAGSWAAASGSIVATTSPILTSAPAATLSEIRPAASAVPSEVILSVSNSKRGWSFLTTSPSATCHLARMPELMDSPMAGTLTSRSGMRRDGWGGEERRGRGDRGGRR